MGQQVTDEQGKARIVEIKKRLDESTPVVSWYAHPNENGSIRGPWNRWFNVLEPKEELINDGRTLRASAEKDIVMFANAPTDLQYCLAEIDQLEARCKGLEGERDKIKAMYQPLVDARHKAQDESAVLHERYRLIELANKEWTRNDAVTFGKLYEQNADQAALIEELVGEIEKVFENGAKATDERWDGLKSALAKARARHGDLRG